MRPRSVIAATIAFLVTAGCGSSGRAAPPRESASHGPISVPVTVARGPRGSVAVVAPVWIAGQGPFPFLIDTGATRSLIDTALARKLHLPTRPSHASLTGVNASHAAGKVAVRAWQLGRAPLPAGTELTLNLAPDKRAAHLGGLIGSDLLSGFGQVQIDYAHHRLTLR